MVSQGARAPTRGASSARTQDPVRTARGGSSRAQGRAPRTRPPQGMWRSRDHRCRRQSLHRSAAASAAAERTTRPPTSTAAGRRRGLTGGAGLNDRSRRRAGAALLAFAVPRSLGEARRCSDPAATASDERRAAGGSGEACAVAGEAACVLHLQPLRHRRLKPMQPGHHGARGLWHRRDPRSAASRQVLSRQVLSRQVLSRPARSRRVVSRGARSWSARSRRVVASGEPA